MQRRSKGNEREGAGEARKARKLSSSSVTEANKQETDGRKERERAHHTDENGEQMRKMDNMKITKSFQVTSCQDFLQREAVPRNLTADRFANVTHGTFNLLTSQPVWSESNICNSLPVSCS